MIKIKRSYILILGISVFLLLTLLVIVIIFFPFNKSICDKKDLPRSCGLISSSGKNNIVSGVITKKYKKEGKFYFEMVTLAKKTKPLSFSFTTPIQFPKIIVNKSPYSSGSKAFFGNEFVKRLSIDDFYNFVMPGMQMFLQVYIPDIQPQQPSQQQKGSMEHQRSCYLYQQSFIDYLKTPSLRNYLTMEYLRIRRNCHLIVASVIL